MLCKKYLIKYAWIVIISSLFVCSACNTSGNQQKETVAPALPVESLRNFILSTASLTNIQSVSRLDSILIAAGKDSAFFHQTVDFLEKPLSDPNSLYRNEDLYIEVLKAITQSPWYDSIGKIRPQHQLQLAMQNRIGNRANDFTYVMPYGSHKRLYDVDADHVLLFFYNPECDACKNMKAAITASQIITNHVASAKLKILAIYTDTNLALWRNHLSELPTKWIAGRDEGEYLYKNNIYDLRAIPTIYLLDRDKRVLLKDCMDIAKIEEKLL